MSYFRKIIWYFKGKKEFTKGGYLAAAESFNVADLEANISTRSFLITGANSGIGFALAESLAIKGAKAVHIVCRSKDRGEAAKAEILVKSSRANIVLHVADMADAAAIRQLAQSLVDKNEPINVLINNAGCMIHRHQLSPQGLEMNFACNTFGTYLLTKMLIPLISQFPDPRVITVSSGGMYLESLDAADMQLKARPFKGDVCYEQQKRQQVVMMEMLALKHPSISFYSMHPGWADTQAVRDALPQFYEKMKPTLRTPEQGADTALWLAVSPTVPRADNGGFFQDRQSVSKHLTMAFTSVAMAEQERFMAGLDELAGNIVSRL